MCPRSGFRSGGTCERTLVPVFVPGEHANIPSFRFFVPGEHPPKPPFWKTTLLSTPDFEGPLLQVLILSSLTIPVLVQDNFQTFPEILRDFASLELGVFRMGAPESAQNSNM